MHETAEVLSTGVYRLSDGRMLTFTVDDVKNAFEKGNRMIAAGLRVPGCWEHDLSAFPEYANGSASWYLAKGYYGDVEKYELRAGKLFARIRFKDPADLSQFKKVGTVSPRIVFNRVDERGVKWPGLTIAHVASTPTPVQRDQSRLGYDFSAAGAVEAKRAGYYDLSTGDAMAEEIDGDAGPGEIISILEKMGLKLGEGVTADNLGHRLEALAANGCTFNMKSGTDADGDGLDDGLETEIDGGANEIGAANNATSPMVMSQLPAPLKIQATNAIEANRKRMIAEASGFLRSGRLTREEASRHVNRLKAANLSLTQGWELRLTPEVCEHNAFKRITSKSGWSGKGKQPADLSQFTEVDQPEELKPVDQEARAKNALEYALELGGHKPKK